MNQLTPVQQDTLLTIHQFHSEHGYMPTCPELAKTRKRAVYPTQVQIERLRDLGYLKYGSGREYVRGFKFAHAIESNGCRIPILGTCD